MACCFMHAYSEYLQEYIAQQNGLEKGGKFRNDFRVTSWGKWLRKWWIDEIPMLINLLRGDLKLIGVRSISRQYFMLYKEEIRNLRIRHKPGLIPPFYADLSKSLDDIMEFEKRYILLYEQKPLQTDISYFGKALRNIVVK